jgi:hypothetical protein
MKKLKPLWNQLFSFICGPEMMELGTGSGCYGVLIGSPKQTKL